VFCSFLALLLKAEFEARIEQLGHQASWPAVVAKRRAAGSVAVCLRWHCFIADEIDPQRTHMSHTRRVSQPVERQRAPYASAETDLKTAA
jgi:hypothetical protein